MAHNWVRHPESETIKRPLQRWRVCVNCGAEQQHEVNYEWGRVVGYCWHPLVGRCKGVKQGKKPKSRVSGRSAR